MTFQCFSRFVCGVIICASCLHAQAVSAPLQKASRATTARVIESYGKLPLTFEANAGQTDPQVKFLARGAGYTLFLESDKAVLALRSATQKSRHENAVVAMRLVGSNSEARIEAADELSGKSNYFIGNDPKQWRTNVPTYAKVKYAGVYAGVDLVYYGNQGQLEYDFVVAPGADPKVIALDLGAAGLRIGKNGDLVVKLDGGEIRFHKPVVYQLEQKADSSGNRTLIDGHFGITRKNQVTFQIANYDKAKPLVIDPMLSYSTFLGGSGSDQGVGIAVDSSGNAYVAGNTTSTDFPTTLGAFQPALRGFRAAFVTKLNPTGTALVYSTYLGGSGYDFGYGIAVDSSGDAYVTGSTSSTDFPTTPGAFQTTCSGSCLNSDGFVTELNPAGSALVYSTYLGGSASDEGSGIAVDASGSAYVTGGTRSSDFPTTPGAFETTCSGSICVFVTKLDPSGSALVYSSYLGGGNDFGQGIAVDATGSAYVTGFTYSTAFPTTPGAFQTTCGGGCTAGNVFVTKLSPSAATLVYSTYLGGSYFLGIPTYGQAIAVDAFGSAYVTGRAGSKDFPTTPGAFQTAWPGGDNEHGFVTKLNPTGSALVYSTFLGGLDGGGDVGAGIALDASGSAYVTGYTYSINFPTTPKAFQVSCEQHAVCATITQLSPTGSALVYSTYLGGRTTGSVVDGFGQAIAVSTSGDVYVTGFTDSSSFPTTPGAFQMACGACKGNAFNAFMASFAPGVLISPLGLNFNSHQVGSPSAAQIATLTNTSGVTLNISSIGVSGTNSGDFAMSTRCGNSLAPGASCEISVIFTPTAAGSRTAEISVSDDVVNSPQTVSLSGDGVWPMVKLSPTSLTFPTQVIFTTQIQTLTLTNSGIGNVQVTDIAVTGQFSRKTTCPGNLVAGASCTISVTFMPTINGILTGSLTITDSAHDSPQVVSLSGISTYLQFSPSSLNFGTQPVGTNSLPQQITMSNKGDGPVSITSFSFKGTHAGDFAGTDTCPRILPSGASCFISVTFKPIEKGTRGAEVSISDDGGGSPQTVPVTGTGT
jgi:hypothetical protein